MEQGRIFTSVLFALIFTVCIQTAQADLRPYCLYEFAEKSEVVFSGKVTAASDKKAKIRITEVLSGKLGAKEVSVSPTQTRSCVMMHTNFAKGDSVLVFGTKAGESRVTIVESGHGQLKLDEKNQQSTIATVKRILEISRLDEDARHKAMLAEATSKNDLMRRESHMYIIMRIAHDKKRDQYKDELIELIKNPDPHLKRTGIQAVERIQDNDLVPLLVECTQHEDIQIVEAASMALRRHDTRESAAALIALTRHENPKLRIRAAVDLGNGSTQPESLEALIVLLDDPDPKVRAMAPGRFVYWFRRREAKHVLPKLVEMLKDENVQIRANAADVLGEYRTPETVKPLLETLKNSISNPNESNVERATMRALLRHYSKGRAQERALIDEQIDLIIETVTKPVPTANTRASYLSAIEILGLSGTEKAKTTLQWAAKHHDDEQVRRNANLILNRLNFK